MKTCKIYDTDNPDDMLELTRKYDKDHIRKCKMTLGWLVQNEVQKKNHESKTGDCCPMCGSIEYYNSGTCKTCRVCGFAGGCG